MVGDDVLARLVEAAARTGMGGDGELPPHEPVAAVLACADARVPPQLLFGQEPGELFTVRVAGNVATPVTIGSLTYAVTELGVELVVVLGHVGCGAVGAAVERLRSGTPVDVDDPLAPILRAVRPAVAGCDESTGCDGAEAVRRNVQASVAALRADPGPLGQAARAGRVRVVGAVKDLAAGHLEVLEAESGRTGPLVVGEPASIVAG
jgi:carbonic anhydrase